MPYYKIFQNVKKKQTTKRKKKKENLKKKKVRTKTKDQCTSSLIHATFRTELLNPLLHKSVLIKHPDVHSILSNF